MGALNSQLAFEVSMIRFVALVVAADLRLADCSRSRIVLDVKTHWIRGVDRGSPFLAVELIIGLLLLGEAQKLF